MDSLTHIVLGATVGELVAGKKLGKKSWLAGAFLQTIPDFDFIAGLWCSPAEDLLAHRGFTHSFFFIALLAPLFSWALSLRNQLPLVWQMELPTGDEGG